MLMPDQPEPLEATAAADRSPAMARRGLLAAGGAAIAGAAVAALAASDKAEAAHNTDIAYDTQTVLHADVTNTAAGSTRISSNISGTAAFVALNNYPVGISRPDGMLARTAYTTSNCAGVAGTCEAASGGLGVMGCSKAADGTGVYGFSGSVVPSELSPGGTGVFGRGPTNGVVGRSDAGTGVRGEATIGTGASGLATTGTGVSGQATTGIGVDGQTTGGIGVRGQATTGTGLRGDATTGAAVHGEAQAGNGVEGKTVSGVGVLGTAGPTGIAGRFVGRTVVDGVVESQGVAANGAVRANKLVCPKTSGVATLARAASSITIPNLPVGPATMALATLQKRVRGLHVEAAVPSASGKKVTIHFNKRAPKGTRVSWMLVN
jgi:hypothetical protein